MCGDSTKKEDVELLMAGAKADMVFTDPPYNVNISGKGKNTKNKIMNDNMSDSKFKEFLDETFKRYVENIKSGGGMYVFHSDKTQVDFRLSIESNGFEIKNELIWRKPS